MKQYEFKCLSPFLEMVGAGLKGFDIRLFDYHDPRHRGLVRFHPGFDWRLVLNNPETKERVSVKIAAVSYMRKPDNTIARPKWLVIWLDKVESYQPCLKAAPLAATVPLGGGFPPADRLEKTVGYLSDAR